jgi:hypothetical protein
MRVVVLKMACVLALAGALGCSAMRRRLDPCGKLTPAPDPPGGEVLPRTFSPEGSGFRVGLPPKRRVEGEADDGRVGETYRWFVFNQGQYEISYVESGRQLEDPATSAEVFDRLKQDALSKGLGRVEVERELRLGTHPGRELRTRNENGVFIQRFYVAGGRLYIFSAFVWSKLEGCALGDVLKTLDSFELTGEGGPASPPFGGSG